MALDKESKTAGKKQYHIHLNRVMLENTYSFRVIRPVLTEWQNIWIRQSWWQTTENTEHLPAITRE